VAAGPAIRAVALRVPAPEQRVAARVERWPPLPRLQDGPTLRCSRVLLGLRLPHRVLPLLVALLLVELLLLACVLLLLVVQLLLLVVQRLLLHAALVRRLGALAPCARRAHAKHAADPEPRRQMSSHRTLPWSASRVALGGRASDGASIGSGTLPLRYRTILSIG